MYQIIEKIASDNGLSSGQASCAYSEIINHLLREVPEMKNVIDSVFAGSGPSILNKEINKMVNLLQYRGMEHLKNISMPEQSYYRFRLNNELL